MIENRGVALLSAKNLCLSFGTKTILDDTNFTVHRNDRIGLLGRNGAGKSTLLKVLAKKIKVASGEISQTKSLRIGYLPQQFELSEDKSALENILEGASYIRKLLDDYENLDAHSSMSSQIEDEINTLDGWNLEQQAETLISSFSINVQGDTIAHLSGGEKRRIALCKTLISAPDLLILDEPTNHLDTESIQWLETFLQRFRGAILLVTHDRYFLDRITTRIYELEKGRVASYQGNYSDYLLQKAESENTNELVEHKRQQQLKKELAWVRAGVKARATKSKERVNRYYEEASKDSFKRVEEMNLVIPPPPKLGTKTVILQDVSKWFGDKLLFEDINIEFKAGERIGIVGRNGLGKTTLVKIILGMIEPDKGRVEVGQKTIFNYVDQTRVSLDEKKTILEEVGDQKDFVGLGDHEISVRTYLQRFLFSNDKINSEISTLSGGEKNRVLLAKILKDGGNFLILDEPSNDLDLATLRVLEEALLSFSGCVLIISHDRYFLNRTCDRIIAFEGEGKIVNNEGNYDYYLEKKLEEEKQAKKAQKLIHKKKSVKQASDVKTKKVKLSWSEQKELESMEANILSYEDEIQKLNLQLQDSSLFKDNPQQAKKLTEELAKVDQKLRTLYKRWQELDSIG